MKNLVPVANRSHHTPLTRNLATTISTFFQALLQPLEKSALEIALREHLAIRQSRISRIHILVCQSLGNLIRIRR